MVGSAIGLFILGGVTFSLALPHQNNHDKSCSNDKETAHYWGNLSPYYSQPAGLPSPPAQCRVSFVQVLSRHGSRFPIGSKAEAMESVIGRLREALKDRSVSSLGEYSFLKDYQYTLKTEALTTFGEVELQDSGKLFLDAYSDIVQPYGRGGDIQTFVRASDVNAQGRVHKSAENFLKGIQDHSTLKTRNTPILLLTEAKNVSDPLWNYMCPAFDKSPNSDVANTAMDTFKRTFIPKIAARLNEALEPFKFNDTDVVALMEMCPYSTVAISPPRKVKKAPFCDLFTLEDWKSYEYLQTLYLQYGFGTSNPLGATRGSPWVEELIARMTNKPILEDNTHYGGINMTLDGNPKTFPLDKKFYLDFTHETDMISIYAALGLFPEAKKALKSDKRVCAEEAGGYTGSRVTPFGARMYIEKLVCSQNTGGYGRYHGKPGSEERVRIIVNGRVMKLAGCGVDKYGTCEMQRWLKTQKFAIEGGDWKQCAA